MKTLTLSVLALAVAGPAWAAPKREHLGDFRDWSTFRDSAEDGTRTCYMTTLPKSTRLSERGAKRDGAVHVMVAHWPSRNQFGVVSVAPGYDYRRNATVVLKVGETAFELYGEGARAWTYTDGLEDDARIVAAMKGGIAMTVSGVAARGFESTDTFSLRGFTAAYDAITNACSQ